MVVRTSCSCAVVSVRDACNVFRCLRTISPIRSINSACWRRRRSRSRSLSKSRRTCRIRTWTSFMIALRSFVSAASACTSSSITSGILLRASSCIRPRIVFKSSYKGRSVRRLSSNCSICVSTRMASRSEVRSLARCWLTR